MKKCLLMIVLFCFLALSSWAQDQKYEHCKDIFKYYGTQRSCGDVWLRFECFTSNKLQTESIFVLPRGLKVVIREDKQLWDSLAYSGSAIIRPAMLANAVFLVANKTSLDEWQGFLTKIKSSFYLSKAIENDAGISLEFMNGIGLVAVFSVHQLVSKCDISDDGFGGDHVIKVKMKLENIIVEKVGTEESYKVFLEVPWGLALAHDDKHSTTHCGSSELIVDSASMMRICVGTTENLMKWQKKLNEWKDLSKPHSVLPPK